MSLAYFISNSGDIICLDGTQSVEVTRSNSLTKSSMMIGREVADGVIEGNKVINITGVCTYTKSIRQQQNGNPDPIKLQELLDQVVRNEERFKLRFVKGSYDLLKDINNCVIVSQSIMVDQYLDTITVNLTIEEAFISQSAKKTYLPPERSSGSSSQISDTKDTKGGKKTLKEEERRTILLAVKEDGVDKILDSFSGGN